jgi:hypothetical protein
MASWCAWFGVAGYGEGWLGLDLFWSCIYYLFNFSIFYGGI